jgi:fructose-bisphosphate aldolase/2-amino-3,7-dideoxy-D-threo-hept-6-ulosonate synthase
MIGKSRRLARLFVGEQKRCLLSPLDHGGWLGPVQGIDRPQTIVEAVLGGGANALLISPGFYRQVAPLVPPSVGIVLRVSLTAGLSRDGSQETPIASLETALRLDADAVAVSIFFGRSGDVEIYRWLAALIDASARYAMPVVAEIMPPDDRAYQAEAIAHAARIGMEIGADVIKTNYCGDVTAFREIVAGIAVPIIIAGGPSTGEAGDTVALARDAVAGGAAGVAIGRRVWQSDDPGATTAAIAAVLHQGVSLKR